MMVAAVDKGKEALRKRGGADGNCCCCVCIRTLSPPPLLSFLSLLTLLTLPSSRCNRGSRRWKGGREVKC
eukprot:482876-Rhodomonas_salina.1